MKRAARFVGLMIVALSFWTSVAEAEVLAEYTYDPGANFNPMLQGWTLGESTEEDVNFFNSGGASLLIQREGGAPNILFTATVPTNVFFDAWSFTGNNRFAGNSQEEFGMFMFADDGTNLWHMSFYNHGNDDFDGIYMGGDPEGPVLGVTATKVLAEPVDGNFPPGTPENKPFDSFHDWALVDGDGVGGAPPTVQLNGVDFNPVVTAIPAPSMFPAGTVGWGSLNPFEAGYFQTTHMVFDGNPDAVPPSLFGDYNGDLTVNAADYAVWRDGGSPDDTIAGYELWKANFGDSGVGAGSAVPEPSSQLLLILAGVLVAIIKTATQRSRRLESQRT